MRRIVARIPLVDVLSVATPYGFPKILQWESSALEKLLHVPQLVQ